jgi:hypothetical protein
MKRRPLRQFARHGGPRRSASGALRRPKTPFPERLAMPRGAENGVLQPVRSQSASLTLGTRVIPAHRQSPLLAPTAPPRGWTRAIIATS